MWQTGLVQVANSAVITEESCNSSHYIVHVLVIADLNDTQEQCSLVDYMASMDKDGLGTTDAILCKLSQQPVACISSAAASVAAAIKYQLSVFVTRMDCRRKLITAWCIGEPVRYLLVYGARSANITLVREMWERRRERERERERERKREREKKRKVNTTKNYRANAVKAMR